MASEEDLSPRLPGRFENLNHFVRDLLAIFNLLHEPAMHVIHDQSQSPWIANVC